MISRISSASGFQNDVDASLTVNHEIVAGSARLLVALIDRDSGDFVSLKWNGVDMPQDVIKDRLASPGSPVALHSLVAPDVGTFDAEYVKSVSFGGMALALAYYTGVRQSAQPDAIATLNGEGASSASYTIETTVDDCVIVTAEYDNIGSIIEGENFVVIESPSNGHYLADSDGPVGAAGEYTIAFSWPGSGPFRAASAAYAPDVPVVDEVVIEKDIQYAVKTEVPATASLQYAVKSPVEDGLGLSYRILSGEAIEKALQYAIRREISTAKGLEYQILNLEALTAPLSYRVILEGLEQKSLEYRLNIGDTVEKALRYAIGRTPSVELGMTYHMRVSPYVRFPRRPKPYVRLPLV